MIVERSGNIETLATVIGMESVADQPLFVAAVDGEAERLPEGVPLLLTGIGTITAAMRLTAELTTARERGSLPSRVINVGTAGAVRDGMAGVYEVNQVFQHDFYLDDISGIDKHLLPRVINLKTTGVLPEAGLATGDMFVSDSMTRERLAQDAALVDMEGYALAAVCHEFGIPVTLLKQVSDDANEDSHGNWAPQLKRAAVQLREALDAVLAQ